MFLVAYDGSPAANLALHHAAALVGPGDELAVINVFPVQSVSSRLETVSDRAQSAGGAPARRGASAPAPGHRASDDRSRRRPGDRDPRGR
jgi:Universal stress protein family